MRNKLAGADFKSKTYCEGYDRNESVEGKNLVLSSVNGRSLSVLLLSYASSLPLRFRSLFEKAATGKASPRQAIRAKCHDCVGYENATRRIRECRSLKCPLWSYRPYKFGEAV